MHLLPHLESADLSSGGLSAEMALESHVLAGSKRARTAGIPPPPNGRDRRSGAGLRPRRAQRVLTINGFMVWFYE